MKRTCKDCLHFPVCKEAWAVRPEQGCRFEYSRFVAGGRMGPIPDRPFTDVVEAAQAEQIRALGVVVDMQAAILEKVRARVREATRQYQLAGGESLPDLAVLLAWLVEQDKHALVRDAYRARHALRRLEDIAEAYAADQSYSDEPRLGMVQPVTVAEGQELNAALEEARAVLEERT